VFSAAGGFGCAAVEIVNRLLCALDAVAHAANGSKRALLVPNPVVNFPEKPFENNFFFDFKRVNQRLDGC